jgi:hypothetical protein
MSHNKAVSRYNVVQPDESGKVPGIVAPFHVWLDERGRIILPEGIMTRNGAKVVIDRPTPMPTRPALPAPPPQEQSLNQLVAGLIASQQVTNDQLGLLRALGCQQRLQAAAALQRTKRP